MTSPAGCVVCVDVGSTMTKAALVEVAAGPSSGRLLASVEHPTTVATDVLHGVDACLRQLGADDSTPVLACSSAGGGLRLAVVGYERSVTAEAGHRVGLSAGARVVHVSAGPLDDAAVEALLAAVPDVVLLVGGTDGGNADVLLHNAARLGSAGLAAPVVLAGNADVREQGVALLSRGGLAVLPTDNVLPRIGVLEPRPARETIREVFVRHVIGGGRLSKGDRFRSMVRAATPDAVLAGVELLADGYDDVPARGDVLVVDVGGATTDVYSVLAPEEEADLHADVAGTMWRARTVEGDLGMRWNAPGVVEAATVERILDPADEETLKGAAQRRADRPAYLPDSDVESETDRRLAQLAVTVAVRRHARLGDRDLRRVGLVVGSGGVLRHAGPSAREAVLSGLLRDHGGGWRVPERAAVAVDARYVLAAAGLLAAQHRRAAARLLAESLQPL